MDLLVGQPLKLGTKAIIRTTVSRVIVQRSFVAGSGEAEPGRMPPFSQFVQYRN